MKRPDVLRHLAGIAAVAAASSFPQRISAANTSLAAVSVGFTGSSSDAPFFIADELGYFRDAGIAVQFASFAGAPMMVAPFGAGQLDVGSGSPSAGSSMRLQAASTSASSPIKGRCAPGYGYGPLKVRKSLVASALF